MSVSSDCIATIVYVVIIACVCNAHGNHYMCGSLSNFHVCFNYDMYCLCVYTVTMTDSLFFSMTSRYVHLCGTHNIGYLEDFVNDTKKRLVGVEERERAELILYM